MRWRSSEAQSLVELALIAPALILMAMAAWDGGGALREQVVLDQAARDGARVAATGYAGSGSPTTATVCAAVMGSAADLNGLTCGAANITYAADAVQVQLIYSHPLITPVLRQVWSGGQGSLTLRASATFFVPSLTPVPGNVAPSTPTPTPTPTATPAPTPTATPAATTCTFSIPALQINSGYVVNITVTRAGSPIRATWTTGSIGGSINILIYPGPSSTYFSSDETNPTTKNTRPPSGEIAQGSTTSNFLTVQTSGSVAAGAYTLYFYSQGVSIPSSTSGSLTFAGTQCAS